MKQPKPVRYIQAGSQEHAVTLADELLASKLPPGRWRDMHCQAVTLPRPGHERALIRLAQAVAEYADAHRAAFGSEVGDDYVTGDNLADIVNGIIGLLSSESGPRLDCGTIEHALRVVAKDAHLEVGS